MKTTVSKLRGWFARRVRIQVVLVILLTLLCFLELQAIVERINETQRQQFQASHYWQKGGEAAETLTSDDIATWMTFSYINFVFKLPRTYLSTALSITDEQYPNIQIRRYVKMHDLDQTQFMTEVRSTVAAYSK